MSFFEIFDAFYLGPSNAPPNSGKSALQQERDQFAQDAASKRYFEEHGEHRFNREMRLKREERERCKLARQRTGRR